MNGVLSQLEREAAQILARLRRLEEIPVPSAAKMLKKTPAWVREHLPVIIHSRKSHSVRAMDIEAYQLRRTIWPGKEFPKQISPDDNGRHPVAKAEGDSNAALSRFGAAARRSHIKRMIQHAKRVHVK